MPYTQYLSNDIMVYHRVKYMFYYMRETKNVFIHFEDILSLGDCHDKRSIKYSILGNSTCSSKYSYAENVGAILYRSLSYVHYYLNIKEKENFQYLIQNVINV